MLVFSRFPARKKLLPEAPPLGPSFSHQFLDPTLDLDGRINCGKVLGIFLYQLSLAFIRGWFFIARYESCNVQWFKLAERAS